MTTHIIVGISRHHVMSHNRKEQKDGNGVEGTKGEKKKGIEDSADRHHPSPSLYLNLMKIYV